MKKLTNYYFDLNREKPSAPEGHCTNGESYECNYKDIDTYMKIED